MPHEEGGGARNDLDEEDWIKLRQMAEKFAETVVVGVRPYRKLARGGEHWDDVVGEFVAAGAAIGKVDDPKEAEAAWALRHKVGSAAAENFFYNQVRKRREREQPFSSPKAQAFLGVPAQAVDRGGDEPLDAADLVAAVHVEPWERLHRREMLDVVRATIRDMPTARRMAIQMHTGLGDTPELDGFEPREPHKDGSGGARGLRPSEIGPRIGKSPHRAGALLREAKAAIREALLDKWEVEDVRKYFPGFHSEE